MTYDPRQTGPDPAVLWPRLAEQGHPSPELWAQALEGLPRHTSGPETAAPAPVLAPDGETPLHVLFANAVRDHGRTMPLPAIAPGAPSGVRDQSPSLDDAALWTALRPHQP